MADSRFDFLRDSSKPSQAAQSKAPPDAESPQFALELPKHHIRATGQEIDGEFFVLKGSQARHAWIGAPGGYENLFKQLCEDGVLVPSDKHACVFADDHGFSSPSAAAAVISGRSANGRIAWTVEGSGQTYGAWQDQQVSNLAPDSE